jgi:hypothetical protein
LLVLAYQAMADELSQMNRRVASAEAVIENTAKAVSSIASLLNSVLKGESFPNSESRHASDDEEDDAAEKDEKKRSDGEDLTKRGRMIIKDLGNVRDLMSHLSNVSRGSRTASLAPAPNLAVVKSNADEFAEDDYSIQATVLRSRRAAAAAGQPVPQWALNYCGNDSGGGHSLAKANQAGNIIKSGWYGG